MFDPHILSSPLFQNKNVTEKIMKRQKREYRKSKIWKMNFISSSQHNWALLRFWNLKQMYHWL